MRYAQITPFEICNGKGAGVSLFVQGCHFHCKGCFNKEAWDFNGGKEWAQEIEDKFFELINRPYIKRVSILGGEPLADENVHGVFELITKLKIEFPDKDIWVYTGYQLENIINNSVQNTETTLRKKVVEMCDILVDGRYIEEQKDLTLKFAGSKNQRLIDMQRTLKENKIVLYN